MLEVNTNTAHYPIYIKDSFAGLIDAFEKADLMNRKVCVITDSNVEKIYLEEIMLILKSKIKDLTYTVFEAGENSKTLDTISKFYKHFTEAMLDRKSVIVALGGGVCGDMAGFAAATFMRGIPFVQIPTTLLSQVDSSVGGKTGVDFMGNKNMIGAFYQPEFVYINTKTLNTLPKEQFSAGMAEAIKYGYISDREYLEMIFENKEKLKNLETKPLYDLIYGACKNKAWVVSKDEKENGLRAILNFGHTFGHAIESLSDFKLLHGECVAIGMMSALKLSMDLCNINEEELKEAEDILKFFDLPVKAEGFSCENVYKQMFYDKKTKNNIINVVLLEKVGKAYIDKERTQEQLKTAIEFVTEK